MSIFGDAWDSVSSSVSSLFGSSEPAAAPAPAHAAAPAMVQLHEDGKQDYAYDPLLTAQQLVHDEHDLGKMDRILRRGYDDEYKKTKGHDAYTGGTQEEFEAYMHNRNDFMDGQKEIESKRLEREYKSSPEGKAAKAAEDAKRRKAEQEEYDDIHRKLQPVR